MTGSSSCRCSDPHSGSSSRGRLAACTSSFSDREHLGSRSQSRGWSSGHGMGIVNGGAYASGLRRERVGDGDARDSRSSRRRDEERPGAHGTVVQATE